MAIKVGFIPIEIEWELSWGGCFVQNFVYSDVDPGAGPGDPWPPGSDVYVAFHIDKTDATPILWEAVIDDSYAEFDEEIIAVTAVIAAKKLARLHFVDPDTGDDIVWATGKIRVN